MDHTEIKERLFDYYDGELPSAERTLIKLHLHDCADCRQQLEHWAQTSTALLQPLRAGSTDYFVQNVMRRVRLFVLRDEGRRWQSFVRWALPTLALSAAAFTGLFIYTMWPAQASANTEMFENSEPVVASAWNQPASNGDPITLAMFKADP